MKLQQALQGALAGFKTLTQSPARIPDFNRAFQDGAVMPGDGSIVEAVIERRVIGELHLPSGRLVACDPAFGEENPFEVALNPGRYPVILSIADLKGDKRVTCAMIQVKTETPVTWKPAPRQGDKLDSRPGYGVDSATGCFMDETTAVIWRRQVEKAEFNDAVTDQMEEGYGDVCCWGNITLDTAEGRVNAVIFSTGYGDGYYRSYWGYTADGEVACLVADFGVFKPSMEL